MGQQYQTTAQPLQAGGPARRKRLPGWGKFLIVIGVFALAFLVGFIFCTIY